MFLFERRKRAVQFYRETFNGVERIDVIRNILHPPLKHASALHAVFLETSTLALAQMNGLLNEARCHWNEDNKWSLDTEAFWKDPGEKSPHAKTTEKLERLTAKNSLRVVFSAVRKSKKRFARMSLFRTTSIQHHPKMPQRLKSSTRNQLPVQLDEDYEAASSLSGLSSSLRHSPPPSPRGTKRTESSSNSQARPKAQKKSRRR